MLNQNPRMIEQMQKLQRRPNPAEHRVEADWFEFLPQERAQFDLILSDLTQGNIQYERRQVFYRAISQALVPGGLFVDRIFRYDASARLPSLDDIARRFGANGDIDIGRTANLLLFHAIASDDVRRAGIARLRSIYDQLLSYDPVVIDGSGCKCRDNIRDKVNLLDMFLAPSSVIWYCGRLWTELLDSYPECLRLRHEFRRQEPDMLGVPRLQVWQKG